MVAYNKLNVIIPMAGYGERFKKAGYANYKPFILIKNKPMIDYVLDAFPKDLTRYLLINPKLLSKQQRKYLEDKGNVKLIEIAPHKKGPAYSIYQARDSLPLDQAFFISYSDIYWTWDFKEVEKLLSYDGIIFTRKRFHPHLVKNSFAAFCLPRNDNPSLLAAIKEKEPFTDNWMEEPLSVGAFYVKSGRDLIEGIKHDIDNHNVAANEFFPTVAYNQLLRKNKKIYLSDVDFFIHWGIPEQLEDFNFWAHVMKKSFEPGQSFNDIKNICSMGGLGKRMKELSNVPKALLDVGGLPMYQFVLEQFSAKENVIITTKKILEELKQDLPKGYRFLNIGEATSSQLETIKNGKKEFLSSDNFFLTSCDTYGLFDKNEFRKFIRQEDPDAIIFTFKPTLLQSKSSWHHTFVSKKGNKVTAVHIKSKASDDDVGLAGFFWFKKGQLFNELDSIPTDTKNEMCADHILKHLVNIGKKVLAYELPYYVHLGTVDEYKEFQFWHEYKRILE